MKRLIYLFMSVILLTGLLPPQTAVVQACSPNVVVLNNADSGAGSLRQALLDVCADGTITFDASLSGTQITLTSQLTVDKNVTIDGSALAAMVTISGEETVRVLFIDGDYAVTLDRLIIADGKSVDGENDSGGGIKNDGGTLTVVNSVLSNNYAIWSGGGIHNNGVMTLINSIIEFNYAHGAAGGGIHNTISGILTVIDSSFIENTASQGGGLVNDGQLTLSGSTLKGNTAGLGGGIYNFGTAIIANATFTENEAGVGSAIYTFGTVSLLNSTFSGNTGSHTLINNGNSAELTIINTIIHHPEWLWGCANDNNGTIIESKNNLIGFGNCGDHTNNADPMLAALADNGGPTWTMALLEGSPAIDAGDGEICSGELIGGVDQRGIARPQGSACDIGAYEYEGVESPTLVVNSINDNDDGVCNETHCSLREAVKYANNGDTITFDLDFPTEIVLGWRIRIDKDLTIIGPGAHLLAVSGNEVDHEPIWDTEDSGQGGVFWVQGQYAPSNGSLLPIEVSISGLTIKDGRAREGGGIYNHSLSTLVMTDCVIGPNNVVTEAGGGISNKYGIVILERCAVEGNHGTGSIGGAGIFTANGGETTLINSTVSGNVTNNLGGGILAFYGGTVNLIHSTITGNRANDNEDSSGGAGGVFIQGPLYSVPGGEVVIHNSIIAGNLDKSADNIRPDVFGAFTSQGGNLIGDGTGSTGWIEDDDIKDDDLVGDDSEPIDPKLGSLDTNAPGTTPTHALLVGSPAIDTVECAEGVTVDQRGITRPQGSACDIGAFELESTESFGELKISKVFDPLTSGFIGNFTIHYNCGTAHTGTVVVGAGQSQTITGIPTGTQCTVTEPVLPTAPAGWTFGTPTFNPANGTVTISGTTAEVTVTNTISRDSGSLKISKVFEAGDSGFTGTFTIEFDCTDGTNGYFYPSSLFRTITYSNIPAGTECTVTEKTLPEAPEGWTFGNPTYDPSDGNVTIISGETAEVTITNTISRDTGSLKINKVFDAGASGFDGEFTIHYNCGVGHTDTVSLEAGASTTVSSIPTGTECTVTEPVLPTAPAGWTFGTPTFNPVDGAVTIISGTTAEVTVTNTISQDLPELGELKISKVFDPLTSGFIGNFTIHYNCGTAHTGTVVVGAGQSQTITGIPTGTQCTVTEPVLPTAPAGWIFGTPTFNPINGTVTISGTTAEVTVTNLISKDIFIIIFPLFFK